MEENDDEDGKCNSHGYRYKQIRFDDLPNENMANPSPPLPANDSTMANPSPPLPDDSTPQIQNIVFENYHIEYDVNPVNNAKTGRNWYVGNKFVAGHDPSPVKVDETDGISTEALTSNYNRLAQLLYHGPFLMAHCCQFVDSKGLTVMDNYTMSLADLLAKQNAKTFLFDKNIYANTCEFTDLGKRMARELVRGLQVLSSRNMDYPFLSTESIVFLADDNWAFCEPKFVDLYAGAILWQSFHIIK